MTDWIHRTFVAPAAIVEAARNIASCVHPAGHGMFSTPLSPTGMFPATHYISSGRVEDVWLTPLSDPAILYAAAQQGAADQGIVLTATQEDAARLLTEGDITGEEGFAVMARLGLMMCVVEDDEQY